MEDETRGRGMREPVRFKKDGLIQGNMDKRTLATLLLWLDKQGRPARSMIEVVRLPLEHMVEVLVETGQIEMVEHTADAENILESRFETNLNRGGRGLKNALHNK